MPCPSCGATNVVNRSAGFVWRGPNPIRPLTGAVQLPNLIILGASARAAAESACRAGMRPWCADLFADRDLAAICPVVCCRWECYPSGLLDLLDAATLPPDVPVLFTGAIENHTPLVDAITAHRPLAGSSAAAMRSVRDPVALTAVKLHAGLVPCRTCRAGPLSVTGRYLVKPLRSTGGRDIHASNPGERIDHDHYLQEYVEGTPVSAAFRADGDATTLVGVTEQIIGDPEFAAGGYQYCGSIGLLALAPRQEDALKHLGRQLAAEHGLHGLFGIDAIVDSAGDIRPVEVNPRYTASVEILERATGFAALAPRPGASAPSPVESAGPELALHAKAIVFARRQTCVGDLYDLFNRDSIADVPAIGQAVDSGHPICTLLTRGPDRDTCLEQLHAMADLLYRSMSP